MKNFFGKEIIPANDADRVKAARRLIGSIPDGFFNRLAQIIARTFGVPIALVSLVDKRDVTFPGNFGMEGTKKVSRGISLCSLAVMSDDPTIFNDALKEPCLLTNPLVTGEFGLRFYAGVPVKTSDNFNIGTVCIVDKVSREFTENDEQLLRYFAHIASQEVEARDTIMRLAGLPITAE